MICRSENRLQAKPPRRTAGALVRRKRVRPIVPVDRHARIALEGWRHDYNTDRPHSPLGWLTPAAPAATFSTIAADAVTTHRTPLMAR